MQDKATDITQDASELIRNVDTSFIEEHWMTIALVSGGFLLFVYLLNKIRRTIRRRKPPKIHPKLKKYGGDYGDPDPEFVEKRRLEAAKILATSTTSNIVGYEIMEQVEAISVDGFRKVEHAAEGLKAAAAMKGANGLVNVQQYRDEKGRYEMTGDAVILRKIAAKEQETEK